MSPVHISEVAPCGRGHSLWAAGDYLGEVGDRGQEDTLLHPGSHTDSQKKAGEQ